MRTINEMTVKSKMLIEKLEGMEVDSVISYQELSDMIGINIQSQRGRGYLETAKKRLRKDKKMIFDTIRNEGIKRVSDKDIVNTTTEVSRKKIRNVGRKAYERITSADYNNLSNVEKVKWNTGMTFLALANYITKRTNVLEIENKCQEREKQLDKREMLFLLSTKNIK